MATLDYRKAYRGLVSLLTQTNSYEQAMRMAVGGEFEAVGVLERELLIHLGLRSEDYLIDVGCGSGRLAKPLSQYLRGKYLGIDIVPELVEYAANLVRRPDWRFEVAEGLSIPESDGQADMVCFFSVFTHLLHEQSYLYLQEAKRVLKPSGKIVFSFLEFAIVRHWDIFELNLSGKNKDTHPPNIFMSRDAIEAWAAHLKMKIHLILDGDARCIPLSHPISFENGSLVTGPALFGQSVCVLSLE